MNLNNHAKNHGKKISIMFVLIDLKRRNKEEIVFVMRAKTHKYNALLKGNLFDYHTKLYLYNYNYKILVFQMLYSIKDRKDLENLNKLASLQDQVRAVRLQDKLGKKNFQKDMKKVFEPVTKSLENTSQDITKTITETSIKNNQAKENINKKLLEIMNDRGILATYLMSPLSKITNPKNTSQFKFVKVSNSNRVNDLPIHNTKPVTLHDNLLRIRDTNKNNLNLKENF